MHTDIHASRGIWIHDPSFREGEDGSCLGERGNCDVRHTSLLFFVGYWTTLSVSSLYNADDTMIN
jgi:hypothetical protein